MLLEDRKSNPNEKHSLYFSDHKDEIICFDPAKLVDCLNDISKLQHQGLYVAGWVSYEAGYYFETLAMKKDAYDGRFPLLHFKVYEECQRLTQREVSDLFAGFTKNTLSEAFACQLSLSISNADYEKNIHNIRVHLRQGDTYQVNYTEKYVFDLQGDPIKLYQSLRDQQTVEYGALLQFDDYHILSLSPELFFRKQQEAITMKPMKGTMGRSLNPDIDLKNKQLLQKDPKLIAENMIIVDLLRNDLSRLCYPGSVTVSDLLAVETYETLHQMTSTVHGKLPVETEFKTILSHLFPCGSITGAPKKRTMEIIHACEKKPRHVYTGSIGYLTPSHDMCFNVAIRTLLIKDNKGELGVGGGITIDSNTKEEWYELQLKARFFTEMDVGFKLIESILYNSNSGYYLLEAHIQRLAASAAFLNFRFDEKVLRKKLASLFVFDTFIAVINYKVRVILGKQGSLDISYDAIVENKTNQIVILYEADRVEKSNVLLKHKTTDSTLRTFYDRVMVQHGIYDDVLFMNEDNQVTESTKANISIQYKGKILTPAVACGLLPGTMRAKILEENPAIEETVIDKKMLYQADKLWLMNSVRGMFEVRLCGK